MKHCGPDRPQLLLLDGHHSHEVLGLIEKARANSIELLTFPPHTTHYLCPLDRCVFGPLNAEYDRLCSEFCQNPGNLINKITWPGVFRKAYDNAVTAANIKSGFSSCGIIPWNPLRIPAVAFSPSEAYGSTEASCNPGEHPLQWVFRTQGNTVENMQQVGSTSVPDLPATVQMFPDNAGDASNLHTNPPSPLSPPSSTIFTSDLSAGILMPIVDAEPREAVESLISLESGSNEIIYEVSLNTSGCETGPIDLPFPINLKPDEPQIVDWNESVNSIFSVAPPPPKKPNRENVGLLVIVC